MWEEIRRTINRPIEFYGKVVDETGTPLAGATVTFGWVVYPEDVMHTNVLADPEGFFALNNATGATLYVSVTKDGYVQGTNQGRFDFHSLPDASFQPDPNNPVVFRLLKRVEK